MTESQAVTRKGLALALLATAQFVVVLDASIVNVALPSIGRALDFSQDDLSWVVNAYTLDLRRLPAARRAHRRPARPPPGLHRRPHPLRRRLAARRPRAVRRLAHRGARRPGPRRGDHLPRRALDPDRRPSPRAPSATARSASGARSPAPAAPPASCSAASSPSTSAGSGCCSSTSRSRSSPPPRPRACCPRAATPATRALRLRGRRLGHGRARRCSSTRSSTPTTPAGARPQTIGLIAIALVAARRLRRDRAPHEPPADAVLDLPPAHAARREHRRPADRHVAVRDVLLPLALHAAGARLRRR